MVTEEAERSYSPEVISTYVWDAIQALPGVADLHRNPLQAIGEKVHLERYGPVRLVREDDTSTLEIHLVAAADAVIPEMAAAVERATRDYLKKMTGVELARVDIYVDDIADPDATGSDNRQ